MSPLRQLQAIGRRFYERNWVLGTSGNFSVVTARRPMRILITASGAHKGTLTPRDFLRADARARPVGRTSRKPSAEALLHLELIAQRGAGAVLHTHSVWSTILSDRHAAGGGLAIEGYEMLKGLEGVPSHAHREWVPILENDQDMTRLSAVVRETLDAHPAAHAFLLRRHGLYTWGRTLAEAERHVEILEFLLESVWRAGSPDPAT